MALCVWSPRRMGEEFEAGLAHSLPSSVDYEGGDVAPDDYEVLVAGVPTEEQLDGSPALRALVVPWAGLPSRTRELALQRPGLEVHNLHHNAQPTAETAIGLLLAVAKRLLPADRALRRGDWSVRYGERDGVLLAGKRATVLGLGHVGRRVARVLEALDMDVRGVRRSPNPGEPREFGPSALCDLLPTTDVIVLTLPATPETEVLLGRDELRLLPPGAILVNVGRATSVDEDALYEALTAGSLGGAGLDVWYRYPESEAERTSTLPSTRPFWELEQVVLSPHRAGHARGAEVLRAEHLAHVLGELAAGRGASSRVDVVRGY